MFVRFAILAFFACLLALSSALAIEPAAALTKMLSNGRVFAVWTEQKSQNPDGLQFKISRKIFGVPPVDLAEKTRWTAEDLDLLEQMDKSVPDGYLCIKGTGSDYVGDIGAAELYKRDWFVRLEIRGSKVVLDPENRRSDVELKALVAQVEKIVGARK